MSNPTSIVDLAEQIARRAHHGQYRRDGITPYIEHPALVVSKLAGVSLRATGWLHDVLEKDTAQPETPSSLHQAGIPETVICAVRLLTRDGNLYDEYIRSVRYNTIARKVKIADILANLGGEPTPRQIVKYAKALLILHDAL